MKNDFNFVDKYVRGMATEKDILSHIAAWHEQDESTSLPDYLGLTEEEHLAFVESDDKLVSILNEYRAIYRRSKFKLIVSEPEEREQSA